MAISVNWPTKVISIPKSYLTNLGGGVYELDIEQFRLDLKDLEDGEQGISYLDTHRRNAPVTLAGATYAQTFEIVNGYTITFEDGSYAVNLVGANNNVSDVTNVNQVSIRSFNTAGMVQVDTGGGGGGGGPTAGEIAARVWDEDLSDHAIAGTAGKELADTSVTVDVTQAKVGQI